MTVAYPRKLRNQLSAQDILNQVVKQREVHMVKQIFRLCYR